MLERSDSLKAPNPKVACHVHWGSKIARVETANAA